MHAFRRTDRDIWKEMFKIDGDSVNFGTNFDLSFDTESNEGLILVGSDGNTHYYELKCA